MDLLLRADGGMRVEVVAGLQSRAPPIEPASGQIEYKALLGVDGGIDLGTVEYQECLHGGMPDTLVAIDERMALSQRETQRRGLLSERPWAGRLRTPAHRSPGCRARPWSPGGGADAAQRPPQRNVAHQARRRYSSWFFCSTRLAAASKSSSRVASRSATAARARSSGVRPRRSASWRRRSACAGGRSIVTFMCVLYRVAGPSNNMVERTGPGRPAAHHARWTE